MRFQRPTIREDFEQILAVAAFSTPPESPWEVLIRLGIGLEKAWTQGHYGETATRLRRYGGEALKECAKAVFLETCALGPDPVLPMEDIEAQMINVGELHRIAGEHGICAMLARIAMRLDNDRPMFRWARTRAMISKDEVSPNAVHEAVSG